MGYAACTGLASQKYKRKGCMIDGWIYIVYQFPGKRQTSEPVGEAWLL